MIRKSNVWMGISLFFLIFVTACSSKRKVDDNSEAVSMDSVRFTYSKVDGIGLDSLYNRRDPSDIIKVGDTYYIWYTRMVSPQRSGYWGGYLVCNIYR
ncbi:hypothetical protein [Saccharicrinis fermentans]|uniref:Uncharacterized protein n=1 Tax=Saccharicrinis fermentans DSM 9555 = JCM 21142 TaxID=869213 RepID=W7Y2X8_9BACT|nr:hypothetical protein [Saccharicrinis fermentans]GAF01938.1 hypothetical protein JCM21142_1561 [Saccharicrinis fermentans DSM 9555 = JCM 21142]